MQTCHLGFEGKDLFTTLKLVAIENLKNQRAMDETLKNIRESSQSEGKGILVSGVGSFLVLVG